MSAAPPIAIYVDADACPVKAEVYKVAERYGLAVHVVANQFIAVPRHPLFAFHLVDAGFDAADDWIAERTGQGAIVVTADIPLAARCLKNGAIVIGSTGKPFTDASIGMALAGRAIAEYRRAMGEQGGGPAPLAPKDRSRFLSALDEAVMKLKRAALRPSP